MKRRPVFKKIRFHINNMESKIKDYALFIFIWFGLVLPDYIDKIFFIVLLGLTAYYLKK